MIVPADGAVDGELDTHGTEHAPRVLVVDDRHENLLAIESVLDGLAVEIDCVTSGADALKQLLRTDYALILLDAHMPEMDGFETARHIKSRERSRSIPIVFLTAAGGDPRLAARGYEAGAVDYLTKPLESWLLRAKVTVFVELWLAQARQHQLNAQLRARTRELERSNRDLEQFAYVASHDLQEPLRKVIAFCGLLRRRYHGQLDERADQYIDFVTDGAERMSNLIRDLLAFSRVGRTDATRHEVDGEALLEAAVRPLRDQLTEAAAVLTHDPMPRLHGEVSLLTSVFQNLLSNAVKFRGDQPPRIHVGVSRQDGHWRFCVCDNGIGVEPEFAERIFVIFQRLNPRERYPGTGIGLALCRKIVEQHGGRIWLDTDAAPGHGARVCFTLPATADPGSTGG